MKPEKLDVATDYRLALLWLMDKLKAGRRKDVLAAFEEEFGEIIPPGHREQDNSGSIRWQKYASWERVSLVHLEFMDSAGHGVWTITSAGEEWLSRNPLANGADLAAFRRLAKREGVDRAMSELGLQAQTKGGVKNIGIEAQQVSEVAGSAPAPARHRKGADYMEQRNEFLAQVAELLSSSVPGQANRGKIQFVPGRNYLQITYAEFPRSHYELYLTTSSDEVAFHLEGDREDNLARLAVLAPHQGEFAAALGHPVIAERWGANWARLAINLPSASWIDSQAQEYAALLARFVEVTYPVVQQAFAAVPSRKKSRAKHKPAPTGSPQGQAHAILDQQLAQIRTFLQGRTSRPSDEVLCDWVQFCYTFELFDEGYELFSLIVPSAVNDWLYGRTKRLAQVCRMRR